MDRGERELRARVEADPGARRCWPREQPLEEAGSSAGSLEDFPGNTEVRRAVPVLEPRGPGLA